MKITHLFLILVLIPTAHAISVSPAKLEFNVYSDDIQEREFFIYNNNDYATNYTLVSNDWFRFYPGNLIEIDPKSNKKVRAILNTNNAEKGNYESRIYVKEHLNKKGIVFENNLAIKTFIDVLSGKKKRVEEEDVKIIKVSRPKKETKTGSGPVREFRDNHFFILLGAVILLVIANLIKKFK